MCAAPLVLPHINRLSVTELMVSVANGVDSAAERSMVLRWTFVIEIDEEGCKEVASNW